MSNERARKTGNFYMSSGKTIDIPKNPFSEGAEQVKAEKAAKE